MIIEEKDLEALREKHKHEKIVFCSGSFDLTHVGHILFFEDCKKHGDILVVAIGNDSITRINKGVGRPILNEHIRLKIIDSFKPVDYCLLDNISSQENPLLLLDIILEKLKPDIYVINEDAFNIPYREEITKNLGIRLVILKREAPEKFGGISTSQIIDKIKKLIL